MESSPFAKSVAIGLLGLGLIAVAAAILVSSQISNRTAGSADAQPPAAAASSPVSVVNGVTTLRLDEATQSHSGLRTEALATMTRRAEATAYGNVLDLQPLIDLRLRHDAAQADVVAARATATMSRAELERDRALYEEQRGVSLKVYQAAQAGDRTDQAKADAAALNLRDIEASAQQQFGNTVASWAFDPRSSAFARLLAHDDVLVRVTLRPVFGARAPLRRIDVQASGHDRSPGEWVSAAAQADPGMAGSSFLYRVPSPLPAGTPVVAYLPISAEARKGVFVPSSAVVWYAGQPWVYVQDPPARFQRRPLGQAIEADGGYFVTEGLQPEERVVTRGAGLLLSQEQRQPAGGAGCKDPECD